ncbi:hypothetical protein BOX15_Mlig001100g1 [Macrostomum lignano]|uniref:Ras-related protein Rab-35 n=1 Tax=Macrostomum lignano TaxID=282301 RepID=A0A267GXZ9_9PLAT|nr:hypothetical protein BOX15_Mlig001100g1 [Macrostomum lignano]
MATNDYSHLFKLLIIGDSGVGKSSLLVRYTDDTFSGSYITTIGVDFKIKTIEVNGVRVKLQIWDTAGQERFRTITATYYRGAHGIIVVYDVNSAGTFLNVKRWFEEIQQHCPTAVAKVIVGNKNDCPETKVISTPDLKTVADEFNVPFVETSAKDNVNVDLLFNLVTEEILKTKRSGGQSGGNGADKGGGGSSGGAIKVTKVKSGTGSGGKKKCC